MNQTLKIAEKVYNKCFILTDHKLTRIIQVARDRIEKISGNDQKTEEYKIFLTDGKELTINDADNILKLDNPKKNSIIRLSCRFAVRKENAITHEIIIDFNSIKKAHNEPIYLAAASSDFSWAQEAISALEEQAERTIPSELAYSINRKLENILMIIMFAITISLVFSAPKSSPNWNIIIPAESAEELLTLGKEAKTENQKLDFLYTYAIKTLERPKKKTLQNPLKEKKFYFIGIPLFLWITTIIYTTFKYYPRNVFAWGDCGEDYLKKLETRKIIWQGVVLASVIGILVGIFMLGWA